MPEWPADVPEWLACPERCRPIGGYYAPGTWVYRVMRGDKSDLQWQPLGLPQNGDEDDMIHRVLQGVHRGSHFRSPFISASTNEGKCVDQRGEGDARGVLQTQRRRHPRRGHGRMALRAAINCAVKAAWARQRRRPAE